MYSTPLLCLLLTANAAMIPTVLPRAIAPGCEDANVSDEINMFDDGGSASGAAGIGVELETFRIQFSHDTCSLENTFKAKGKIVRGHPATASTFVLSVDTSTEFSKGTPQAEYVLDGTKIKVGEAGAAKAAGRAVYDELVSVPSTWLCAH